MDENFISHARMSEQFILLPIVHSEEKVNQMSVGCRHTKHPPFFLSQSRPLVNHCNFVRQKYAQKYFQESGAHTLDFTCVSHICLQMNKYSCFPV